MVSNITSTRNTQCCALPCRAVPCRAVPRRAALRRVVSRRVVSHARRRNADAIRIPITTNYPKALRRLRRSRSARACAGSSALSRYLAPPLVSPRERQTPITRFSIRGSFGANSFSFWNPLFSFWIPVFANQIRPRVRAPKS